MNWDETRQFLGLCFPERIRSELDMLLRGELREIRLRVKRPTVFVTATRTASLPWEPTADQLTALVEALSEHSLYARADETGQGYITLRGGHRMGLCGRIIRRDGQAVLADIGSACIRIAGEWPGASAPLMPFLHSCGGSLLIIGAPGSGKTTLLRDIARQVSTGTDCLQVALVDERSELAACVNGIPQLDVGANTDVLDGLGKADAIRWLIRTMSPQMIITDELGNESETQAILEALTCGVMVCASAHGSTLRDAAARPALASLMSRRAFGGYVVLSSGSTGQISALHDRNGNPVSMT